MKPTGLFHAENRHHRRLCSLSCSFGHILKTRPRVLAQRPQAGGRRFEIEEGTRAYVESTPEGILIKPVTTKFILSLRGLLKGEGVMKAMMEDRKAEREL